MTQTINEDLIVTGNTTLSSPVIISTADVSKAFDPATGILNVAYLSGVDPTGVNDSTPAIQAALNFLAVRTGADVIPGYGPRKLGGTLLFPHGATYRFNGSLSYDSDGPLSLIGGSGSNRKSTKLIQNFPFLFLIVNSRQSTTSFPYDASESGMNQLEIGGFELVCDTGANNGLAFRIENPESAYVHDIRAAAAGTSAKWQFFFDLLNVRGAIFERMYIRNDVGTNDISGVFIYMRASNGTTDSRYSDMTIQGFDFGFYAYLDSVPSIEGQLFSGVTFVGCNTGIKYVCPRGVGGGSPQLQFINGHMQCFRSFFEIDNITCLLVADCHFELNNDNGFQDAGILIRNVTRYNLHDFTYINTGSSGAKRNSARIVVDGNSEMGNVHDIRGYMTSDNTPFIVTQSQTRHSHWRDIHIQQVGTGNFPFINAGASTNSFASTVEVY